MRILALDCGTKTGWAASDMKYSWLESGVQDFSLKRGDSAGMRFLAFRAWLGGMIERTRPNLIVYEQPHRLIIKGGCAAEIAFGMTTRIQEICSERGLEHTAILPTVLKKFATGKGNAKKEVVLAAAKKKWPDVQDDNEADALWILEWAKKEYGQ
jgi:Holliday junction resolvasome RuvABC endonuclease subunit